MSWTRVQMHRIRQLGTLLTTRVGAIGREIVLNRPIDNIDSSCCQADGGTRGSVLVGGREEAGLREERRVKNAAARLDRALTSAG